MLDDLQTQLIADNLQDPRHRMTWSMKLWMGNRIGESQSLQWRAIDWDTGAIRVTLSLFEGKLNKPKTKAGKRMVVLNPEQLAELRAYKDNHQPDAGPDDWVFPG
jgi:integrase